MSITISNGLTIRVEAKHGDRAVILDHPSSPIEHRNTEVGRITEFQGRLGFQPAPFSAYGLSPEALRGIAQIIERESDE